MLGNQARQEANTVTQFVARAVGNWTGTFIGAMKIKHAVGNRRVLGGDRSLNRKNYAMSPVLKLILNYCMKARGVVFVLQGDPGMGKTTALFAVMGRYARKGVAIFPGEQNDGNYQEIMLTRLNLDSKNPPKGWLTKFLNELDTPFTEDPAVLMLDDFMNGGPTHALDEALLRNIKNIIRGKNIVVIVLTTNKQSANLMLTWNNMVSIIPAGSSDDIRRWGTLFRNHKESKAQTEFEIDWNENNRMRWETDQLKNAIFSSPMYVGMSSDEKKIIETRVDVIIQKMGDSEREILNPEMLQVQLSILATVDVLESPRDGWDSAWNCNKFW
jgi:hypothetical protein